MSPTCRMFEHKNLWPCFNEHLLVYCSYSIDKNVYLCESNPLPAYWLENREIVFISLLYYKHQLFLGLSAIV